MTRTFVVSLLEARAVLAPVIRTVTLAVLFFVIAGGLAAGQPGPARAVPSAGPTSGGQDTEPPVVCEFRNPAHAGSCEERTPYVKDTKLEAICKPILDCLNNVRCTKTYCGSTTVRQGWRLESAKRDK
jgi:hypothetical protein